MINVLCLTLGFYPFKTATSKIVKRIVESKEGENYFFYVVSGNREKCCDIAGKNFINYQFNRAVSHSGFSKDLPKRFLLKIVHRKRPYDYRYVGQIIKTAKNNIDFNNIDLIVCFAGDFASFFAGVKLSKTFNKKLFLYYADPFYGNPSLDNCPKKWIINNEKKWLNQAVRIAMPSNYVKHFAEVYPEYLNKVIKIELPCSLNDNEVKTLAAAKRENIFLHCGSFIFGMREPRKVFELMIELKNKNISYDFVSLGFLEKRISQQCKFIPSNVHFIDRVSGDELLEKVGSATALVLVDNAYGIQIPSKAFEYVCTGLPIIFFKSQTKSETYTFLEKVKANVFVIDNDTFIDSSLINKLIKFLEHRDNASPLLDEYNLNYIYSLFYNRFLGD